MQTQNQPHERDRVMNTLPRLKAIAWVNVNLRNNQVAHPLPAGHEFKWLSQLTIGYGHAGESPEVRVAVEFVLDYLEGEIRPIDLSLKLMAHFQSDTPLDSDTVARFVHAHALSTLWPYLHEAVNTLTFRSGGPAITLPLEPPQVTPLPAPQRVAMFGHTDG